MESKWCCPDFLQRQRPCYLIFFPNKKELGVSAMA